MGPPPSSPTCGRWHGSACQPCSEESADKCVLPPVVSFPPAVRRNRASQRRLAPLARSDHRARGGSGQIRDETNSSGHAPCRHEGSPRRPIDASGEFSWTSARTAKSQENRPFHCFRCGGIPNTHHAGSSLWVWSGGHSALEWAARRHQRHCTVAPRVGGEPHYRVRGGRFVVHDEPKFSNRQSMLFGSLAMKWPRSPIQWPLRTRWRMAAVGRFLHAEC
jgi:hypothetical protein